MRQEKFNFKNELREYIDNKRENLSMLEETYILNCPNEFTQNMKEDMRKERFILDKLEEDYFNPSIVINDIKEFDEDGNLIKKDNRLKEQLQEKIRELYPAQEKENSTTEQVEEGLLKIFNALVEHGEFNIGDCDFNNEKYSTSLCQIADKLLQIESDRNLREEYYKNCTID